MTSANRRAADHPIDNLFLERWSPRAFTSEEIQEADLKTILEAGRWAPSAFNAQPWRFLYARRGTAHWETFVSFLNSFNAIWAKDAAVLIVLASNSLMMTPGADRLQPSRSHSLDSGAAAMCVLLQATRMGWSTHGMTGFNAERAFTELNLPIGYKVEAMYAIGRRGDPSSLPEKLQARETPSGRLPLSELAFEGTYPAG